MSELPPGRGVGPLQGPPVGEPVRVGTWNCSYWTSSRLSGLQPLGLSLCALQETKLAEIPLENARGALKRAGFSLHHGQAAAVHRAGFLGDKAGVGFLASPGVAVSPLFPRGPAWRRLHAMARLHGVAVPPRPGLPRGLHLFSVYAPLQDDAQRTVSTWRECADPLYPHGCCVAAPGDPGRGLGIPVLLSPGSLRVRCFQEASSDFTQPGSMLFHAPTCSTSWTSSLPLGLRASGPGGPWPHGAHDSLSRRPGPLG